MLFEPAADAHVVRREARRARLGGRERREVGVGEGGLSGGDRGHLEAAEHLGVARRRRVAIPGAFRQRGDLVRVDRRRVGELEQSLCRHVDAQIADRLFRPRNVTAETRHEGGDLVHPAGEAARICAAGEDQHFERAQPGKDRAVQQDAVAERHAPRAGRGLTGRHSRRSGGEHGKGDDEECDVAPRAPGDGHCQNPTRRTTCADRGNWRSTVWPNSGL